MNHCDKAVGAVMFFGKMLQMSASSTSLPIKRHSTAQRFEAFDFLNANF